MTSGSQCPPIYHGHRTAYIYEITGKARQKAAWVLAVFRSRSKDIMLTLYMKSMVCSLLEYCSPLWNPVKIFAIQELESVQKVFTSKISGIDGAKLHHLRIFFLQKKTYGVLTVCSRYTSSSRLHSSQLKFLSTLAK